MPYGPTLDDARDLLLHPFHSHHHPTAHAADLPVCLDTPCLGRRPAIHLMFHLISTLTRLCRIADLFQLPLVCGMNDELGECTGCTGFREVSWIDD